MIGIIDYDAGNTCSVINALKRLHTEHILSADARILSQCEAVIFPGVGHAFAAMNSIRRKKLDDVILKLKQPVLGICVGMQLFFERSEEGATDCLGIMQGQVRRFAYAKDLKVPHMGWNKCFWSKPDPLLEGLKQGAYFYFVHSYYHPCDENTLAYTNYSDNISAVVRKNNYWGIQFHAEKSAFCGERILHNFIHNCKV